MDTDFAIRVENLSKIFSLYQPCVDDTGKLVSKHYALRDVSFEIKKGESVGIIGPNGSGKSTLLKILAGITKPTSGEAIIKGKIASVLDIGAGFHQELSGRENVFLNGQILGFSRRDIQEHYEEIISFSGIEMFIDEPVKNYSNGMYLRLAFSIMAHLDFDVYLFDEVLSVGDENFRKKSFPKIKSLVDMGKTIILISHNFSEIAALCNMVYTIKKGRLTMKDTIDRFQLSLINQDVKLPYFVDNLSVQIKDIDGDSRNDFFNNEVLLISVDNVYNDNKTTDINIALRLKDNLGVTVFTSSPMVTKEGIVKIDYEGNKKYVMKVPSYYFNQGTFFIDIVYFSDGNIIEEVSNISYFSVKLSSIYENIIGLGEKGHVKPFFEWTLL